MPCPSGVLGNGNKYASASLLECSPSAPELTPKPVHSSSREVVGPVCPLPSRRLQLAHIYPPFPTSNWLVVCRCSAPFSPHQRPKCMIVRPTSQLPLLPCRANENNNRGPAARCKPRFHSRRVAIYYPQPAIRNRHHGLGALQMCDYLEEFRGRQIRLRQGRDGTEDPRPATKLADPTGEVAPTNLHPPARPLPHSHPVSQGGQEAARRTWPTRRHAARARKSHRP